LQVPKSVEDLLPARFDICEATLMEEHEPDRWRARGFPVRELDDAWPSRPIRLFLTRRQFGK
jgi:hypothetical protein